MDTDYAVARSGKKHLSFRYRVRALMVGQMVKKYRTTKNPIRLLDFGCAEGRTLTEISNILGAGRYVGIEYSQSLLDCAPRVPENIRLLHGDVTALSGIKEKEYDVVTALAVLEHLSDPVLALKEARRVLRPGGLLIATCPDPFWDHISGKLGLVKDEHHATDMNKRQMINLLKNSGFEFIGYQQFMWSPVSFLPYLKIPLDPSLSVDIDIAISKLRVFNWLFVNQCIVGHPMK